MARQYNDLTNVRIHVLGVGLQKLYYWQNNEKRLFTVMLVLSAHLLAVVAIVICIVFCCILGAVLCYFYTQLQALKTGAINIVYTSTVQTYSNSCLVRI